MDSLLRGGLCRLLTFVTIQMSIGLGLSHAADDPALQARIQELEQENAGLKQENSTLKAQLGAEKAQALSAKSKGTSGAKTKKATSSPTPKGLLAQHPEPEHLNAVNLNLPFAEFLQEHFILRESVFDEQGVFNDAISQPATLSYTNSRNGVDSWATDVGVGYLLAPKYKLGLWDFDGGIGLDYHRNTTTSSKKDIFQTGAIGNLALGDASRKETLAAAIVTGNVSYKDDDVKDVQTVQAALGLIPVKIGDLSRWLYMENWHRKGPFLWRWEPFAGLIYDSTVSSASTVASGDRFLARYGASFQALPLYGYVKDSVEFVARYTAWSKLEGSGVFASEKSLQGYLDCSLTYWFKANVDNGSRETAAASDSDSAGTDTTSTKSKTSGKPKVFDMGIGIGYQNGDNPELSLKNVNIFTLSFQAKY